MSLLSEQLARAQCAETLAASEHARLVRRAARQRRAARLARRATRLTARADRLSQRAAWGATGSLAEHGLLAR